MTKLRPVDAVIIGGGWTGLLMAKELASRSSLSVVVLDRGGPPANYRTDMDEVDYGVHQKMMLNPAKETITLRHTEKDRALPFRRRGNIQLGSTVGGQGEHWGGVTYRFLPDVFQTLSRTMERYGRKRLPEGHAIRDWPITYEELETNYLRAERLMGISGRGGNIQGRLIPGGNVLEGPRSAEYPNPPLKLPYLGKLFMDATTSMGYHPYITPAAILSRPYTNPDGVTRTPCVFCGFCGQYGCMIAARAQPSNTLLPVVSRLKNCELRTSSWVRRIQVKDGRAVGVQYTNSEGEEIFQPADLVVLSAYGLDNTRLLLLSGIGEPYDPKTGKGTLGSHFSIQLHADSTLFFEEHLNLFMGSSSAGVTISDFDSDILDHSKLSFIRGGIMRVTAGNYRPIGNFGKLPERVRATWGSEWKKESISYFDRAGVIQFEGEHLPYKANYLDLDPVYKDRYGDPLLRITVDWRENERQMAAFCTQKAVEIGRMMGAKEIKPFPGLKRFDARRPIPNHIHGGTIMGTSAADSVLNKYGQHWQVQNLFVTGGSAFPQCAGPNPTLTIMALAYRSADVLIDRYLKQPGWMA